jgi:hypothetical protein
VIDLDDSSESRGDPEIGLAEIANRDHVPTSDRTQEDVDCEGPTSASTAIKALCKPLWGFRVSVSAAVQSNSQATPLDFVCHIHRLQLLTS